VRIAGIVLAAGAGRRMGGPKALLRRADGTTWAAAAAGLLADAGCAPVLVAVGARAGEVAASLPAGVVTVEVPDWADGPGAGIGRALRHPALEAADAVALTLVDLPHLTVDGVRSVLAQAAPDSLVRAVEDGRPGHPVLLGRTHLARALETAAGGRGLAELFRAAATVEVPGSSTDADTPADVPPGGPAT
jgi:CTP:molybdopterin cytidylyltransferase MocA